MNKGFRRTAGLIFFSLFISLGWAQEAGLRVPPGCRAKPGTVQDPYTGTDWARDILHEKTGIELVLIPAGAFFMGTEMAADRLASLGEKRARAVRSEQPVHTVTFPQAFYAGKFEVTNEQYQSFVASAHYEGLPLGTERYLFHIQNQNGFHHPTQPIIYVSWQNAKDFCAWAGGRLPSEAEWEYMCRGGMPGGFWLDEKGKSLLREYAWFCTNSGARDETVIPERASKMENSTGTQVTHPVGLKKPNPWGLHDILGNVAEWCEDVWHDTYEGAPTDGIPWTEGGDATRRVARGGLYKSVPEICKPETRVTGKPNGLGSTVGFRIILDLE